MRDNKRLKGYLILTLSSLFLLSFTLVGSSTYDFFFNKGTIKENTKIASIEFGGLEKEEALVKLNDAVEEWKKETNLVLQLNKESVLDLSVFTFHPDQTVEKLAENSESMPVVTIDEQNLLHQLNRQFDQQVVHSLDMGKLKAELLSYAMNLTKGIYVVDLKKFIQQANVEKQVLNEAEISVGDQSLPQVDEELSIGPGATFSLQQFVEEKNLKNVDDVSLSRLATAVYGVFMTSPVDIVERHISTYLPEYAILGKEAAFIKDKWDLKGINTSEVTVDLSIRVQQDHWIVQVVGINTLENYKVVFQNEVEYAPRKIVQYDPALSESEVKVIQTGEYGQAVTIARQLFQNNQLMDETILSNDYYQPKHKIEKHGLKSMETINQSDENREQNADSNVDQAPVIMTPSNLQTGDAIWEIPNEIK